MATLTLSADRNCNMDNSSLGVTITDNSGASMTKAIELNIDKSKVVSPSDIIQVMEIFEKFLMSSEYLAG